MPQRTLWEEGRHPGRLVVRVAVLTLSMVAALELLVTGRLGLMVDLAFVVICLGAALWVHPRDFFTIGVLPPLLLAALVGMVAVVDRGAVAQPDDPFAQAMVTGLAHRAIALVVGYALVLSVLALRQVALRHHGTLRVRPRRTPGKTATPPGPVIPQQRTEAASPEVSATTPPAPPPAGHDGAPAEAQR